MPIAGKATICLVNYKTLDLTRLCLRSVRKLTKYPYEVIVIDNNSRDDSLEYLRRLKRIRLIERQDSKNSDVGYAHAAGLDLGLANCNTEFDMAKLTQRLRAVSSGLSPSRRASASSRRSPSPRRPLPRSRT